MQVQEWWDTLRVSHGRIESAAADFITAITGEAPDNAVFREGSVLAQIYSGNRDFSHDAPVSIAGRILSEWSEDMEAEPVLKAAYELAKRVMEHDAIIYSA